MSDDGGINQSSLDSKIGTRIKTRVVQEELYKENHEGDRVAASPSPASDTEATDVKSWTIAEAERAIAAQTLRTPKRRLAQFGLDLARRNDFRLRDLSRKLKDQISSDFSSEIKNGAPAQRLRSFDIQSQTMRMVTANSTLGSLQFQKAQVLPFMRKSLALGYEKTNLLKQSVGAIRGLEKAVVSKLEAIKMNTAATVPKNQSFFDKIKSAVEAKGIDRIATNVSNMVMEKWDEKYKKHVSPLMKDIQADIKKPGPDGGINAVKSSLTTKLNKLRHRVKDVANKDPATLGKIGRLHRRAAGIGASALGRVIKYSHRNKLSPSLNESLTNAATPTVDRLAKLQPFAPPTPPGAPNPDLVDGTPGTKGSHLELTSNKLTSIVRDWRAETKRFQQSSLGHLEAIRKKIVPTKAIVNGGAKAKPPTVLPKPFVGTPQPAVLTDRRKGPWDIPKPTTPVIPKKPTDETSFFTSLTTTVSNKLDAVVAAIRGGDQNRTDFEQKQVKHQTQLEKLAEKSKIRKGSYEDLLAQRAGRKGKEAASRKTAATAAAGAAAVAKATEDGEEGFGWQDAFDWAKDKLGEDEDEDKDKDDDEGGDDEEDSASEEKERKKKKKARRKGQTRTQRNAVRDRARRMRSSRRSSMFRRAGQRVGNVRRGGLKGLGRLGMKGLKGGTKGIGRLGLKGAKGLGSLGMKGLKGSVKGVGKLGWGGVKGLAGVAGSGLAKTGLMTVGKGLLSAGAGMGVGLVAGVADQYVDTMDDGWKKRAAKTATTATQYGAMGATIGGLFGGVGAVPGAAIGAAVGAVVANADLASSALKGMAGGASVAVTGMWSSIFGSKDQLNPDGTIKKGKPSLLGNLQNYFFGDKAKYDANGKLITAAGTGGVGAKPTGAAAGIKGAPQRQARGANDNSTTTAVTSKDPSAVPSPTQKGVKLNERDPSAKNIPAVLGFTVGSMGASSAVLGWAEQSGYADTPTSPYYVYVSQSLEVYGVTNRTLYKLIHAIEISQDKVNKGQGKAFDDSDMAYMAGRFGFDIKNTQALDYFKLWYKRRFVPGMAMTEQVLKSYKLTFASVLSADEDTLRNVATDLKKQFTASDLKATGLEPSVLAYNKYAKIGGAEPTSLSPSTQSSTTPFDPRNPSNQQNPTNFKTNSVADIISRAFGIFTNSGQNQGGGQASNDNGPGSFSQPYEDPKASRKNAAMAKGNVKDQPEFKAAFAKLPPKIQKMVSKSNPLQFVLWSTAVQHGPDNASQIFQRDYSDQLDEKAYVRSIYQDRSTRFSNLNESDRAEAVNHLSDEQKYAMGIFDGTSSLTRGTMGGMVNNVLDPSGNYTLSGVSAETVKGSVAARAKQAVAFFMSRGYTKEAAVGVVANLMHESGVEAHPRGSNDGGAAHGVAQWHGDRQRAIAKQFGKSVQQMNLMEQLAAVDWEMKTGHGVTGGRNLVAALNKTNNAGAAAVMVMQQYERPADHASNGPNARGRAGAAMGLMRSIGSDIPRMSNSQPAAPAANQPKAPGSSVAQFGMQAASALGVKASKPAPKPAAAPAAKPAPSQPSSPAEPNMAVWAPALSKSLDNHAAVMSKLGTTPAPTVNVGVGPLMQGPKFATAPGWTAMSMKKARNATGG